MPIFEFLPSCRIYYLDENVNASNSVLLLHGLGVNSNSWLYQLHSLIQAGFRPIAPDAPGFGQSTYPGGRAVIDHFVGDPFIWLGKDVVLPFVTVNKN